MADGQPLIIGTDNVYAHETTLTQRVAGPNPGAFSVENDGGDVAVIGSAGPVGVLGQGKVGVQGQGGIGGKGVLGTTGADTPLDLPAAGVVGASGNDPGVYGISNGVGAVVGVRGDSSAGTGVHGDSSTGTGVLGTTEGSTAILGIQGNSRDPRGEGVFGVAGTSDAGVGVQGFSTDHTGVRGDSANGTGVIGDSANGTAVIGQSITGTGILGTSDSGTAIRADSDTGTAISGFSGRSDGLRGESNSGIGIHGVSQGGIAAQFDGNVVVNGDFSVTGVKSALVPCPDGSHRRFYSLESPESWFEDFGTGQVVGGRGPVRFDPEFAALTRGDKYHVFLTPRGDCRGLYVNAETSDGFEVHELQGGTSSVSFDYRVVARRKDVAGPRLECVTIPACT